MQLNLGEIEIPADGGGHNPARVALDSKLEQQALTFGGCELCIAEAQERKTERILRISGRSRSFRAGGFSPGDSCSFFSDAGR
jgi:hypothetical protein